MSDQYEQKIKESQKLRDLGFYVRALEIYREVEKERSGLRLAMEISGTLLEQGCVQSGLEKISAAIVMFSDDVTADKMALPLAQMLRASTMATVTVQFSPFFEVAVSLYNDQLVHCPVENYEQKLVSLLSCPAACPSSHGDSGCHARCLS